MTDTTHELSILARARDEVSAVFKKMGVEGQRAMDGVAAGSKRASDGVDKLQKGGVHLETMKRGAGQVTTGLFMLGNAADGAAGKVGQLVQHGAGGFMAGGPWMAGLALATGLFGLLTSATRTAREEQDKLAASGRAAAAESRRAADEKTKQQQDFVKGIQREIELLEAKTPEDKKKVVRKHTLEDAREAGGLDREMEAKKGLDRKEQLELERKIAEARSKSKSEVEAFNEAQAAGVSAEVKAYGDRRAALADEAREYARRAALSAESLKHDSERQKIAELLKLGLSAEAQAMQRALDATIARERAETAVRARMEEQRESLRALDEQERQMARARSEEAEKRKADAAVEYQMMLNAAELWGQKQRFAQKDPVQRLDGSDPTGGWQPGSGMGPLATAREAKRQKSRDERHQRHADNLGAEARERMGFIDSGWVAPAADVPPRKSVKFVGPDARVRNDDGSLWHNGEYDESRGPTPRIPGQGRFQDGRPPGPPPTSPSGADTPYVDGRGEGEKELGDAVASGAEGAKGADDSLKQVAADAKSMADSLNGIKASSEEMAGTSADTATAAQDAATKQGEILTAQVSVKEAILDWAARAQEQIDELMAFKDGFATLGTGG